MIILTIRQLGKFQKPGYLQKFYHEHRGQNIPMGIFLSNYRCDRFLKTKKDVLKIPILPEYSSEIKVEYNCLDHRYELNMVENKPIRIINNVPYYTSDMFRYAILYLKYSEELIGCIESVYPISLETGSSIDINFETSRGYKCILMDYT